ncbi:MAG: metallophosphoesterase, partial [Lachnospiraceae bacterium]|nr:metallophosphoesterase [Lachnospiraceae bacterium]
GAWIAAHHVLETDYTIVSNKVDEPLRIALIADAHLGLTLDGEDVAKEMKKIQAADPDLVVIVGDYVDDDSNRVDTERACEALGELNTNYGVYYVFGNHDTGYYRMRDFSELDLRKMLTSNGVTILEDEAVTIGDDYVLIGRRDRSTKWRSSADTLMQGTDPEKYSIMLDHQPNDYDAEAAAGTDLVLSGHTHGGHMFPAGLVGLILKSNDKLYGLEERENTTFIVTSGISGWAIPFKTGTHSEYVIIDIQPES